MTIENRYNLIDEPWIPIVDVGRVSLRQVFSQPEYRALGGNPVQKIALTKLLLAIAQSAYTPEDDEDWATVGADGLAQKCLAYLEQWHDRFYLYGDKPFLQMPVLEGMFEKELLKARKELLKQKLFDREKALEPKPFGAGFYPDVLSDNSTILVHSQISRRLNDADRAVFITSLMNFSLGGKRINKDMPTLTIYYQGKTNSAKSAPSLGNYVGYLHSYLIGSSVQETIFLNLLTREQIQDTKIWVNELGKAPWEEMPAGENCEVAQRLKNSYMGCLLALSRFVLLKNEGVFYIEGIQYPSHKDGWFEPSISINRSASVPKLIWLDVNKKPWRNLTSLLSFLTAVNQHGYDCQQIRLGFQRVKLRERPIGIWSGGLKVRASSGDQSVKQDDDFIESYVALPPPNLITGKDSVWFSNLSSEVKNLEEIADILGNSVYHSNKREIRDSKERDKRADSVKGQAQSLFWQLCERQFQNLIDACGDAEQACGMRPIFAQFVNKAYDSYCPNDTARQLDAWAKNRPNLAKYLHNPNKEPA
ncbi:MAG: type I-E CRISPR-associated protein Cse1/CasA [Sulfuriferula sp.]|nr:type I-E CRISPR-associated protein Cse1/CasA [Sulfuriferula sp.]